MINISDLINNQNNFKFGDKVRVLRNDTPEKGKPTWKTAWFARVVKAGSHFAYLLDYKKTDVNLANLDSCEWCPYESKMLKIIKD